jgi:hypothetical protein
MTEAVRWRPRQAPTKLLQAATPAKRLPIADTAQPFESHQQPKPRSLTDTGTRSTR